MDVSRTDEEQSNEGEVIGNVHKGWEVVGGVYYRELNDYFNDIVAVSLFEIETSRSVSVRVIAERDYSGDRYPFTHNKYYKGGNTNRYYKGENDSITKDLRDLVFNVLIPILELFSDETSITIGSNAMILGDIKGEYKVLDYRITKEELESGLNKARFGVIALSRAKSKVIALSDAVSEIIALSGE